MPVQLSATAVQQAKPGAAPRKMSDGGGLYLLVQPNGSKLWRYNYRYGGKQKTLALGIFPDVSLAGARERHRAARALLADGVDPGSARQRDKSDEGTFEAIARAWMARQSGRWSPGNALKIRNWFEADVFPWIGARAAADLRPRDLIAVVQRIEQRGAGATAHRVLGVCSQVFRFAVAGGLADSDPTRDLRGFLAPVREKHRAAITDPKAIGELLRAIEGYSGDFIVRCALKLAPLVFVRPGELRRAEWSEFDLDAGEWRIPGHKMKMRSLHIVPLSVQAIAILQELSPLTGAGTHVFPGARGNGRPMSENTVNAALRRLGYDKDTMTGHGFRSMASTLLNEQGWNRDAIERQLAHSERDRVRAAYNHADYLPERRTMMQAWADYLDALREDRKVVSGRFGRVA